MVFSAAYTFVYYGRPRCIKKERGSGGAGVARGKWGGDQRARNGGTSGPKMREPAGWRRGNQSQRVTERRLLTLSKNALKLRLIKELQNIQNIQNI